MSCMTTATRLDLGRAARLFHALSDETRLDIVLRLRSGERCVCDLMGMLETGQSRLSFHMRVLKDAGLVSDRREGRWIHYSLDRETFAEVEEMLRGLKPSARRLAVRDDDCC
jgi:ArsR family transcriptional regulator